jgi:hypothetical protein
MSLTWTQGFLCHHEIYATMKSHKRHRRVHTSKTMAHYSVSGARQSNTHECVHLEHRNQLLHPHYLPNLTSNSTGAWVRALTHALAPTPRHILTHVYTHIHTRTRAHTQTHTHTTHTSTQPTISLRYLHGLVDAIGNWGELFGTEAWRGVPARRWQRMECSR